ncbi:CoA transferase [Streptomyces sp. NPDC090499]|uniref:CaiB/BaiF CoA-transferase family protein n=1 Tax=Streptomyces sp. NPDC090499 TaxID=3365965 RepID=UPI00382BCB5B
MIALNAFEGVRVLDFTTGIAGPLAGTFFADFGADVLKIEPPDGDPERRTASFVPWNRGKRAATAALDEPADRARVRDLVARADLVLVRETAVLTDWGIDPDALLETENSPVILRLPVWQGRTPWAGGHESQALLAAASGYSRRQSSYDGGPVDIVYPHLLYIQALMGATAAAAALTERLRSARGQIVTVDGMHAVAEAFTGNYTLDPGLPVPDSGVGPGGANPTYTHYQASDGKWFLIAGLTPKFQAMILRAIGEQWIIDDPRIAGDLTSVYANENREWVRARIKDRLATRTREEWLTTLRDAGVPCAVLNEPHEAFGHPQSRAIGIRQEVKDATYGQLTIVGQPVTPQRTPPVIRGGAPEGGNSLGDLDWLPRDASSPGTTGGWKGRTGGSGGEGPLAGVRVLLLGSFVAGPYGAFLVGHLGADVIKIEPPEGDPWRTRGFYYSDGMRSVALNLKDPAAHEVYLRLAADADVIVDNLRPGVPAALRVGYDDVVKVNPDIVTVSLTGFGQEGPLAMEPGFDPVLQAWSGMSVAQGGDHTPVLYTVPVNDVCGAGLIAFAACLGLFHRCRTGDGQPITTSLAAAGMFMQCGQLVEGATEVSALTGGRDFAGPGELDSYYRVADGWVRVQALAGTTADDLRTVLAASADCALEEAFASRTTEDLLARLYAAGIPAAAARLARDVVLSGDHPGRFELHRPAEDIRYYRPQRYAEFSRTPYDQRMRPPGGGEHSLEILAELGLSSDEVADLLAGKAVHAGGPMTPRVLNPYR